MRRPDRGAARARALVVALLAATAGCFYSPSVPDCAYTCGAAEACPDGLGCADGYCRVAGALGTCGGGAIDAMPAPPDATPLPDAATCTGTEACVVSDGQVTTAPCNPGPAVGSCVPPDFAYCECGGGGFSSFFVETVSGNTRRVIATFPKGLTNVGLQVDGLCYGLSGNSCDLTGGTCGTYDLASHEWPPVDITPGAHNFHLWKDDVGVPCTTNDGGSVVFSVSITL